MNPALTEIAFVLDRSGSMAAVQFAAIQGFNQFLRDQQALPGQAHLSLVLFDDQYDVLTTSLPVAEVTSLDAQSYVPCGSTALLDAIGRTIDELGARLAALPEANRPGKVIVAILTDGEENASARFTWPMIAERIKHQTEVYQWEFFFLGAGQDAIATASMLSIAAHNAATFAGDAASIHACTESVSRKTKALRSKAAGFVLAEEQADIVRPMGEILKEEDQKRRGKN